MKGRLIVNLVGLISWFGVVDQQRCPYSVEKLSSLLPGRNLISYSALLAAASPSSSSKLSPVLDDGKPSIPRTGLRSVAHKSKSLMGGAGMHKRPSLSGSISSINGLMGSGAGTNEILDSYTDKVDALLRKIIRQRRDDDPDVREWFDEGWGVAVEAECTLDGCRLRHFKNLQRLDGIEMQAEDQTSTSQPNLPEEADYLPDLGRFSPFDAGSQFNSPAASQRRSQEVFLQDKPIPSNERLGSFAEEKEPLSAEATPRIPFEEARTPRPDRGRMASSDSVVNSEGLIEAELKWIIEHFPLPPKVVQEVKPPQDKFTPEFNSTAKGARQQRPETPPQSPTSIEIRLRQASLTPSSTYSARSSASNQTTTTIATTVSATSRQRGSTSTCFSYQTDFSDSTPSNRSSRDSNGPLTPKSVNGADAFLSVQGDGPPPFDAGSLVSPKSLTKPLPARGDWRPKTPPRAPPSQLPQLASRPPPSFPPPSPPKPSPSAEAELGEPIRLPIGRRQFSSMSVISSASSSNTLGLPDDRSTSPRRGSLMPPADLEASADGFRYHRPHQGVLNPYLRKSPSPSPSLSPLPPLSPRCSISPESTAMPRSATSAALAGDGSTLKIFKIFIPSAERTISVSVGLEDTLIELRDKIAVKLKRTNLELPDKWSLATAQLSSTREKIVGEKELELLLAGKLRNGDSSQPCVLRVVEA